MIDLSVVIPAFNEERTITELLNRVTAVLDGEPGLSSEVILVDDGSTDRTAELGETFNHLSVSVVRQEHNSGKGAAVQRGIRESTGRYVLVQDADVEYFPEDIPAMLATLDDTTQRAVYGSRVLGAHVHVRGWRGRCGLWPGQGMPQRVANLLLRALFRRLHGLSISDPLTGYKLYPSTLFDHWTPTSTGFETDHEITCRLIKLSIPIVEVPVRYSPRTRAEGKKIKARDLLIAVRTISNGSRK